MKNLKPLLVLVLSVILFTGMAQQQIPSKITFQDGQGTFQRGVAEWEACPTTSFFSQPPTMPNGAWAAYTSDIFFPFTVYENFTGVTQPIGIVHFWGLNLLYNGDWFDCSGEDPMTFEIKFYQDNAGAPGGLVYTETISILRDPTGLFYNTDYQLYHYKAVLSNPVNLPAGWISVQAISAGSPDNCVFLWMNSQVGDNIAYQWAVGTLNFLGDDLSLCFEAGAPSEVPLAPWALILGAVLIAGSVFLRYRRIF